MTDQAIPVRMGWTIRFGGTVFLERDLTLAQALQYQELTGHGWPDWPGAAAVDLAAILAVCLAGGDNSRLDGTVAQVATLNMLEALNMITPGEPPLEDTTQPAGG